MPRLNIKFGLFKNIFSGLPKLLIPLFSTYNKFKIWASFNNFLAGTLLGHLLPGSFAALGGMQVAKVNLPVAVLIWLMIIPMLLKIDFGALGQVREHWRGIGVTLFINWAVKPFSMALLGWIFIGHLFAGHSCRPPRSIPTSPD